MRHGAAEAIEAVAHGDKMTSKVVDRTLEEIKLPKNTTIGAIARDDEVIIRNGKTRIEVKDHIILFVSFSRYGAHRDLQSYATPRSSDLKDPSSRAYKQLPI